VGLAPTFCFGLRMGNRDARLTAILRPAIEALGYELVGVQYNRGRRRALVRVYIDKHGGVTLDDCERSSHQVSGILDVEDSIHEQYDLEVSSPGPDRPLFEPEHYERYAGQKVRIGLSIPVQGRRKLTGTLLGLRGGEVLVNEDGVEWAVPLAAVGTARLVPAD